MVANPHLGLAELFSKRLARLDKHQGHSVTSFRIRAAQFLRKSVLCPIFQSQLMTSTIVVSKPSVGLSVTYRKQGRVLVAPELWRNDLSAEEPNFYVRAWKAALAKAQSLSWIY